VPAQPQVQAETAESAESLNIIIPAKATIYILFFFFSAIFALSAVKFLRFSFLASNFLT